MILVVHIGFGSWFFYPFRIPNPGVSGSATLIGSSTVYNKHNYFLKGTWLLFKCSRRADPQLPLKLLLLDSKLAADQRLLLAVAAVASQRRRRNSRPDLDTAILPILFKYSFFRSAINQLPNRLRYLLFKCYKSKQWEKGPLVSIDRTCLAP